MQLVGLTGRPAWALAAVIVVAVGGAWRELVWAIPEELAFRGVIQGELSWRLRSRVVPVVLAALAFAVVHAAVARDPVALATFAPAVLFGGLRTVTGSVWPAVAAHAVANVVAL